MMRATWRILALGALMSAAALPASAQVVIGGSGQPNVEVNWAVLESLGRQPTLADMLKNDAPASDPRAALSQPAKKAVQFRPYKAESVKSGKAKAVKPAKAAAAPKPKSPITPASAKAQRPALPAVAELVQAAQKAEAPKAEAAKAEAAKVEAPKVELPKVAQPALPPKPVIAELPKAEPKAAQIAQPEIAKPVQTAKVEAPPAPAAAPAPVSAPVAAPAPAVASAPVAPPMALTPPPAPVAPPVAKVEPPKSELVQLASVAPAVAAPVFSSKSDSLTIAFGADSARLPDNVHGPLDALVKRMQKDDGIGLQLLAYAEGDDANASKARRLSLSRALEVRKYLMEQGVRSTRIEVRALGNKMDGSGPGDRVDAVVVSR